MNSFYSLAELKELGFKSLGDNVLISKKASFYSPEQIEIGSHVRIDDFCILSGNIKIGSYVHISAYNALYGKFGIEIGDFCGISPRCIIFSATDDFSGNCLISPMVPPEFTNVIHGKVKLENYCQIGANSIITPNITIGEGTVTGAFTYINKSLESWAIYIGIPARKLRSRSKGLLKFVNKIQKIK